MKQEDIEHLATLSRIELSGDESKELAENITAILEYVGVINEIAAEVLPLSLQGTQLRRR